MQAFVPNAGFGFRGNLSSGLQRVCGSSLRLTKPACPPANSIGMSLSADQGITLQTLVYKPDPVISGVEDKDIICYRVWKQVFGNAYVMDSEKEDAYNAESMFRAGQIPLREFVRAVALSATYRRRFFECCGPYRAVELNFKHLLGRGPNTQEEVAEHIARIANEGFEAEISSYVDSEEYEEAFGDDYVPCMRFKGTYRTIEEFNRMCTLYSSPGTTDKSLVRRARSTGVENPNRILSLDGAGYPSRLVSVIATGGKSTFVTVKKAIPGRPDLDLGQAVSPFTSSSSPYINERAAPRTRVEVSMNNYMYLTEEEAKSYRREDAENTKIVGYAQKEISDAKSQIALLQQKIAELSLVN